MQVVQTPQGQFMLVPTAFETGHRGKKAQKKPRSALKKSLKAAEKSLQKAREELERAKAAGEDTQRAEERVKKAHDRVDKARKQLEGHKPHDPEDHKPPHHQHPGNHQQHQQHQGGNDCGLLDHIWREVLSEASISQTFVYRVGMRTKQHVKMTDKQAFKALEKAFHAVTRHHHSGVYRLHIHRGTEEHMHLDIQGRGLILRRQIKVECKGDYKHVEAEEWKGMSKDQRAEHRFKHPSITYLRVAVGDAKKMTWEKVHAEYEAKHHEKHEHDHDEP